MPGDGGCVLKAVLVPCVVVVGGTLVAGYGWTWLGPTALHVPTELRVLATPAVSLGVFFHAIAHGIGIPVSQSVVVSATQLVCGLLVVAGTLWLVWNAHRLDVVRAIGLALVLIVVGSPTLWPWYLTWGFTLLAATTAQRSRVLAAVAGLAMLVVGAGGSPMLNGLAYVVTAPLLLAGCAWLLWDRHWQTVGWAMTPEAPAPDGATDATAGGEAPPGAWRGRHADGSGPEPAGGSPRAGPGGSGGRSCSGRSSPTWPPGSPRWPPSWSPTWPTTGPDRSAGPLGRDLVPARRRAGMATPPADGPRPRGGQHHRLLPGVPDRHPVAVLGHHVCRRSRSVWPSAPSPA